MSRSARLSTAICACALFASACTSLPPPSAGRDQASSDLILRASGKGNWEVACTATTARGTIVTSEMDGRGRKSLACGRECSRSVVYSECEE